jgi:copper chaperone CopZ
MKTILAVALLSVFAAGCADSVASTAPTTAPTKEKPAAETPSTDQHAKDPVEAQSVSYKLSIDGMFCEHCVANVKAILEKQPGVESVRANLVPSEDSDIKRGEATIKLGAAADFSEDAVRSALDKDSYKLTACEKVAG